MFDNLLARERYRAWPRTVTVAVTVRPGRSGPAVAGDELGRANQLAYGRVPRSQRPAASASSAKAAKLALAGCPSVYSGATPRRVRGHEDR